ncbi:pyrroline-5-carboxylate reductase [Serpentinicella alkaliphila]|uniref:Pyrroline-5-carboxylate reductase n=1 Tax=Serpentinicella alkaliphila TaxID=1734049 RepID=A0A4R2TGQ9_9FIRM|nr:pyrroline-5-carboxylate reductase [Serpentinicella alkaliphila]QUH25352.1 pyrroline-5-carboxylate reductase [Serpentinicella alkaliphila]TCQ02361.1 pyrroline-5-carboxylate reductase [Serpentinicella alkaliphila]
MSYKIGFIGSGNMAFALINGLTYKNPNIKQSIYISDKDTQKCQDLASKFNINICTNNSDLVSHCDIIFLAVKPNIYPVVLNEIKAIVTSDKILISIAAGISIAFIESFFQANTKIVRTMPNTPVLVLEGMTAITPNRFIPKEEIDIVVELFESVGKVDIIDESLMDMIPAISGSSPAYVYMFIESLADGAVLQGMSRVKAYTYASQAVLGAAKMVSETRLHPGDLKDNVCSPGGTTIEAVFSLEKNGFRSAVIDAMNACTNKAKLLSNTKK